MPEIEGYDHEHDRDHDRQEGPGLARSQKSRDVTTPNVCSPN